MRGDARKKAADIHGIRMRGEVKVWIGVGSDQIRSVVGGIGDGDGERVGCGKRRIVSRIKWYPSLSVSSPCRSFSLLHPLRSARLSLFHPLASSPSLLLAPRGSLVSGGCMILLAIIYGYAYARMYIDMDIHLMGLIQLLEINDVARLCSLNLYLYRNRMRDCWAFKF